MSDRPKIIPNGIEVARELEAFKHQLPLMIQQNAMIAELKYEFFQSLVKSGFTDKQALEIVKAEGN